MVSKLFVQITAKLTVICFCIDNFGVAEKVAIDRSVGGVLAEGSAGRSVGLGWMATYYDYCLTCTYVGGCEENMKNEKES
jgi:hypothetical protein